MTDDHPDRYATREDVHHASHAIQQQIERWTNETRERSNERHAENIANIKDIVQEMRITNGRVVALETNHKNLQEEFQGIRKRWHDFRDSIQLKVQNNQGPAGPQGAQGIQGLQGENRNLTMRDFNIAFASVSLGFALFYTFAKLMKWLP